MKTVKVGIIGYGKMGQIYSKEIKKLKKFKVENILRHKNILKNPKAIDNFFNSKKIDLFIISSPIKTHFKYLKHAFKANKDIIVEKPLVENENQLKKLINLNKKFKKKIMIHHNDVVNFEKMKFKDNLGDLKMIKKIQMTYGKKEIVNSYKKPFLDWLPHPLSVIVNFLGKPDNVKIIDYSKNIKNKLTIENLRIVLYLKSLPIFLKFSNNLKIASKKIIVYENNKVKTYNGYNKLNRRSIKFLLEKFYNTTKINEVDTNQDVYKLLFKIDKQIDKFNKT
jgi:predicted dehydrogenase